PQAPIQAAPRAPIRARPVPSNSINGMRQAPATLPNAIPAVSPSGGTALVCPKCGFVNRPEAKFCKHDGQPLLQGATAVPPQPRIQVPLRQPIQSRSIQARPIQPRPDQSQTIQSRPIVAQPIRARPVAGSAAPAGDPVAAYRMGLQYLNSKNFAESVNQFKLALSLGRSSYDVLYNLGRAYRQYAQASRDKDKKLFTDNMKMAAE